MQSNPFPRRLTPAHGVFAFTAIFMGLFFLWPIGVTLREAFVRPDKGFTLEFVGEIFRNPVYMEGLWNSLKMAVGSTIGALLIALPLAVVAPPTPRRTVKGARAGLPAL